jgi:hypothetical protein
MPYFPALKPLSFRLPCLFRPVRRPRRANAERPRAEPDLGPSRRAASIIEHLFSLRKALASLASRAGDSARAVAWRRQAPCAASVAYGGTDGAGGVDRWAAPLPSLAALAVARSLVARVGALPFRCSLTERGWGRGGAGGRAVASWPVMVAPASRPGEAHRTTSRRGQAPHLQFVWLAEAGGTGDAVPVPVRRRTSARRP